MKYPLPHGYEIHSGRSHQPDSTLRYRDSWDRCRDTRLLRRPGHSKRTIPCPVFFADRHYSGCRDRASLYIGSRMIVGTQLSVTAMRPRSKRKTFDDSFFISPERRSVLIKNRMLSSDGETNCTYATRSRNKKDKRFDWQAKTKIYSRDRSVPRKSVFYFG